MAEIHTATSGALTRALVDAVAEFVEDRGAVTARQSATFDGAAKLSLGEILADIRDDLAVDLAVVLATFGVTADGEVWSDG